LPQRSREPALDRTKTSPPIASPSWIDRERLFARLDAARRRPIVWIGAPAGAGKTSLLASYVRARRLDAVWYRVDETDRDPGTFFAGFGAALRPARPPRRRAPPRFTPEHEAALAPFARAWFAAAYGGGLRAPLVVVLDDIHKAAGAARFDEVLGGGLARVPAGATLVVLCRGPLPAALAARRAAGEVEAVAAADLRFDAGDVAALARALGLGAGPDAERVRDLTDGWAAGVALCLESARAGGVGDVEGAVREDIFAYFATEVFRRLPDDTRRFLCETALLPAVTPATAARLTGLEDAERRLAALAREHCFTRRHEAPDRPPVYVYHDLFRSFLLERGSRAIARPARDDAGRRAARILLEEGRFADAVALLARAGAFDDLAAALREGAPALLARGMLATLEAGLDLLPPGVEDADGWLTFWRGQGRLSQDPAAAADLFRRSAERHRETGDQAGALLSSAALGHAIVLDARDLAKIDAWAAGTERALAAAPPGLPPAVEHAVAGALYVGLTLRDPGHAAIPDLRRRVLDRAGDADPGLASAESAAILVHDLFHRGDLRDAEVALARLAALTAGPDPRPIAHLTAGLARAMHAFWRGDLAEARATVEAELRFSARAGLPLLDGLLLASAAQCRIVSRDPSSAEPLVERMGAAIRPGTFHEALHHLMAGWLARALGRPVEARRRQELYAGVLRASGMRLHEPLALFVEGLARHDLGETEEGRRLIAEGRTIAARLGEPFYEFVGGVHAAEVALSSGRGDEALAALRESLPIGRARGFLNAWWSRRDGLSRLAALALDHGVEPAYVRELVARHGLAPPASTYVGEAWPWRLRVRALGGFAVERDGAPLPADGAGKRGQGRPLDLLRALVAEGEADVPEERLREALWPDAPDEAAHRAFATTLHRLRRRLGDPDLLVLAGGRLSLDGACVWTDARAFEDAARAAAAAAAAACDGGEVSALRPHVERVLGLYRGPLLGDREVSVLALPRRARLEGAFRRAVVALAGALTRAGDLDGAADLCERASLADPLGEPIHERLMAALLARGRRAAALAAYERCRAALQAEVGAPPGPAIEALRATAARG